jgi:N-acyl-L-homoserine lactone synthetase
MKASKYQARIIDRWWFAEIGKLRYDFFCDKKGWVTTNNPNSNIELDRYDDHAIHFGVFSGAELVGYMRAIPAAAQCGMMIDHDFRECVTDDEFKHIYRENAVEVSRRVTALNLTMQEQLEVVKQLFCEFYYYCRTNAIEHVFTVQEPATRNVLTYIYGLQFNAVNKEPYTFADGGVVNVDYSSTSANEAYMTSNGMMDDYMSYMNNKLESSRRIDRYVAGVPAMVA